MRGQVLYGIEAAQGRVFYGDHHIGDPVIIRTYYGPGQPPTAAPGTQLNHAGSEFTATYTKPNRWPPPGALLRKPQVAWINLALPYSHTTYLFDFPETLVAYGGGQLVQINDSGGTGGGELGDAGRAKITLPAYGPITLEHPEVAERTRLRSAAQSAKEFIESIRPGITFVDIFDFYDDSWSGNTAYPIASNVLHCTAPSLSSTLPYFGTEFVHVFLGAPVEDRRNGFNDWVRVLQDNQSDWEAVSSLSTVAARLAAAVANFSLFRILVFSPNAGADPPGDYPIPGDAEIEVYDYPPLPEERPLTPGDIYVLSPFDPDTPAWEYPADSDILLSSREACEADATDQAEARQASIDIYHDQTTLYYSRSITSFGDVTSALESLGVEGADDVIRVVGTYQEVTARSLVRAIAATFNFDPDTGVDLG